MKVFYKYITFTLLACVCCIGNAFAQFPWTSGFEAAQSTFIYSSTVNTATNIAGVPRTGTRCGGFTSGGDADGSIITGTTLTFTPCRQYVFTVYARVVTCYGFNLKIVKAATATNAAMNAASGSDILYSTTLASPNSGYTAYSVSYIPQTTETMFIGFQMNYSGAAGPCGSISMYIDDISITETILPVPIGGTTSALPTTVGCQGSSTITLAGSSGIVQWQKSINGGASWVNISGATTATLATGALTTATDYRALLTGAACATATSAVATVAVSGGSATWLTTGTTAWATATNWSTGVVPTACTNVTIPSGGTQPTISAAANCNNLTINAGAILTRGAILNIYGNLIINGSLPSGAFNVNLYGVSNTWGGSSTFSGTAYVNIQNNANYTLISNQSASIMNNGGLATTGVLNYDSYTLTVTSTWYCTFFNNFNTGMLRLQGGGSVDVSKSNYDTGTLWIDFPGTVNFGFNLEDDYYNVWFNSNSAIGGTIGFGRSGAEVVVKNNFWIRGTTATVVDMTGAGANSVRIGGDFTNDGVGAGSFLAKTCVVWMNGTKTQYINGTGVTTFSKLRIDNSTAGGVVLGQNEIANGTNTGAATAADPFKNIGGLDLLNGPLFLNSKTFTLLSASVLAITRTNGYIVSETNVAVNPSILQWNTGATTGTYTIPFGTSGGYIPLTFAKTAGTSNMQFSTRATAADNLPLAGVSSVASVNNMFSPYVAGDGSLPSVIDRWWDIHAISGPSSVTANLTFRYIGAENTTTVAPTGLFGAQHWNGTGWDPQVGTGTGVTGGTIGSVIVSGANTFSPWILSSRLAPLPIELINFEGYNKENYNVLNWATATEINNDYFNVEKSTDGVTYRTIGEVDGAGNSLQKVNYSFIDKSPKVGINYYRLTQTDFDKKSEMSHVISIENKQSIGMDFYPNPTTGDLQIIAFGNNDDISEIRILNLLGELVSYIQVKNNEINSINLESYNTGIYIVELTVGAKMVRSKLIKR